MCSTTRVIIYAWHRILLFKKSFLVDIVAATASVYMHFVVIMSLRDRWSFDGIVRQ